MGMHNLDESRERFVVMTNLSIPSARSMLRRGKYVLAVGAVVVLAACSGGSHSSAHSLSTTEGKAKVVATAADTQIHKDGYAPLHLWGFGKVDLGYKPSGMKYEAVYTYTGNQPALVKDMVTSAQQKSAGDKGVKIFDVTVNGKVLIVAQAATVHDLHTVVSNVLSSLK